MRCDVCLNFPIEKLLISDNIRKSFPLGGPIMKSNGIRFLSALELLSQPQPRNAGDPFIQPLDYSESRCCLLCNKFWYDTRALLERHRTLFHPDARLTDLCANPFQCGEDIPRVVDSDNIPWGEFNFCKIYFASKALRTKHHCSAHPTSKAAVAKRAIDEATAAVAANRLPLLDLAVPAPPPLPLPHPPQLQPPLIPPPPLQGQVQILVYKFIVFLNNNDILGCEKAPGQI